MKAKELGSGIAIDPVYAPVNAPAAVVVPVTVDSPVYPVKAPVPPVNSVTNVMLVAPPPVSVPLPEKVPNMVPSEKVSTKVPLDKNAVRLIKVMVPVFAAANGPDTESTPEPVKLESKTAGLLVAVEVEVPVRVPDVDVVSA